tara:strand:- start:9414 stop:9569 length:156 start_codon:yes stop_codon:yes gene_type:complete
LEYYPKSGPTVDFSEIYCKSFEKPYKHSEFLTKKWEKFDEKKQNWAYGKAI